jgi:hypothetical protein
MPSAAFLSFKSRPEPADMHPAEANAAAPKANSLLVILFCAKGSAPVLLDNPVLSHAVIIPKTRLLYQFYCIFYLIIKIKPSG